MTISFYDLPEEIIKKIYTYDSTYTEIYKSVVSVINRFPVFHTIEQDYFVFLKEYNFGFIHLKDYLRVSSINYSFKKAVLIIIKKMSKPNTLNI